MSYSCYISFKQIPEEQVIPFIRTFKQCCTERLREIAQDEWHYVPYIRRNDLKPLSDVMSREEWRALSEQDKAAVFPREFRNVDDRDVNEARYWMRGCVFYFRYTYDRVRQLLAMFGVPTQTRSLFDGTVYFQNSCDQDYERDAYKGIETFEAIWDMWDNATPEILFAHYQSTEDRDLRKDIGFDNPNQSEEERQEKLKYYCRDAAYEEIWSHYSETLYDDTNAIYVGLYDASDIREMNVFLKACHDACVKDKEDADAEWIEALIGQRPQHLARVQRFAEANGNVLDIKHELELALENTPWFLERYPQYEDTINSILNT